MFSKYATRIPSDIQIFLKEFDWRVLLILLQGFFHKLIHRFLLIFFSEFIQKYLQRLLLLKQGYFQGVSAGASSILFPIISLDICLWIPEKILWGFITNISCLLFTKISPGIFLKIFLLKLLKQPEGIFEQISEGITKRTSEHFGDTYGEF